MKKIVALFLLWKILLYCVLLFSLFTLPLQFNFLGGGVSDYLKNVYLWPFVNFDGVHYLTLSTEGYRPLTYFYFPLYPLLIKLISGVITSGGVEQIAAVGVCIANASFLIALYGFYLLIKIDYPKKIAYLAVVLLLVSPASFYFGALYNEALFFAVCVWSFYFYRKKKWVYSGLLAALATATRVVGIAILPALMVELYLQWKKEKIKLVTPLISILLGFIGIGTYLVFMHFETGNFVEFISSVGIFGQQRSSSLVLLPQVFYRYIFKVMPAINYNYFPVLLTTYLELAVAVIFGFLAILAFYKLRLSYTIFSLIAYLIPTLSGSFSSLPRYVLVLFPLYLLIALYVSKANKYMQISFLLISVVINLLTAMLFYRGFWVA